MLASVGALSSSQVNNFRLLSYEHMMLTKNLVKPEQAVVPGVLNARREHLKAHKRSAGPRSRPQLNAPLHKPAPRSVGDSPT